MIRLLLFNSIEIGKTNRMYSRDTVVLMPNNTHLIWAAYSAPLISHSLQNWWLCQRVKGKSFGIHGTISVQQHTNFRVDTVARRLCLVNAPTTHDNWIFVGKSINIFVQMRNIHRNRTNKPTDVWPNKLGYPA